MRVPALLLTLSVAASCPAAPAPEALPVEAQLKDVQQLVRSHQNAEAVRVVEAALPALDDARAAGQRLGRTALEAVQLAIKVAREDLLDYDRALGLCDKLFGYAETDYWRVPARLERALTYRAKGDFEKARQEYAAIAAGDKRYRARGLLPQAEMVYFEVRDLVRGRKLLEAALREPAINDRERFGAVLRYAARAVQDGRVEEALEWYRLAEQLPASSESDRARSLTRIWYEWGHLEESLGRSVQAKEHYRKARDLESGDMRFRVRARDALEAIEYFE